MSFRKSRREESVEEHIATIIQTGTVEQKTSWEIMEDVTEFLREEAEMWQEPPSPGQFP